MTKNETNITYLFGAGASIGNTDKWYTNLHPNLAGTELLRLDGLTHGIPITSYLNVFRAYLRNIVGGNNYQLSQKTQQEFFVRKGLYFLLNYKLQRAFTSQLSPDTYGKSLKISGRNEAYENFKWELSSFINFFDCICFPDVRYPNLLTNLIEFETGRIPANINFLSNNFDAAPEKSYYNLISESDIETTNINVIRKKYGIVVSPANISDVDVSASVWLKLHGSAGELIKSGATESLLQVGEPDFTDFDHMFLTNPHYYTELEVENNVEKKRIHAFDTWAKVLITGMSKQIKSNLRFAWDIDNNDALISLACQKLETTNVLIVVGYTFPPFNQKNDFKLLAALCVGDFDRVVIQLPNSYGQEVRQRILQMFKNLNMKNLEDQIEIVPDCSSFHITVEFFSKR